MTIEARREANLLDRRLLRLQSPARPWTIRFEATLAEPLTPSSLLEAIDALTTARPEVSAGLDPNGRHWQTNRHLSLTPDAGVDQPLDLRRSGIRISLPASRRLLLDVNHGFTDGLGGLRVLDDLLRCCRGETPPARRIVDDDALRHVIRHDPRTIGSELSGLGRQLGFRPARWPVTGATSIASTDVAIERIRLRCTEGSTLNDVLVATVHLALAHHLGTERVSVAAPVDLRRLIGDQTGLGNAVLNASTRSATVDGELPSIIPLIAGQLERETDPDRLGARLAIYAVARPGPPASSERTRRLGWPETAVCSNLGTVDLAGCTRLVFAPPAHDLVTIGIATRQEVATITARARGEPEPLEALLATIDALLPPAGG